MGPAGPPRSPHVKAPRIDAPAPGTAGSQSGFLLLTERRDDKAGDGGISTRKTNLLKPTCVSFSARGSVSARGKKRTKSADHVARINIANDWGKLLP